MKNIVLPIIAVLLLAGCVGQAGYTTPQGTGTPSEQQIVKEATTAKTVTIDIKNFEYSQPALTINKGDTVKWVQMDSVAHTVTSDTDAWTESPSLKNGESFEHTFTDAGTFTYHCMHHPYMKGKVIVQ